MLTVTFYEDSHHRLSSFVATGHADAAAHGEDVVCAAVSALLQGARLGLEAYAHVPLEIHQEPGDMRIGVSGNHRDDEAVRAILATALLSVEQISKQYPQHVRFNRVPLASSEGGIND